MASMADRVMRLTEKEKQNALDSEALDLQEIDWDDDAPELGRPETPTCSEVAELGRRIESEVCEFQATMRDGRIYAGRTPYEEAD